MDLLLEPGERAWDFMEAVGDALLAVSTDSATGGQAAMLIQLSEHFRLAAKQGLGMYVFDPAPPKPILRIIRTMLEDKDVCVRRLREGYEFFKSMAQRRSDLEAAKTAV